MKNPTIKDVALRAKVSIATVSRVLNNQPGYSEATKKKVLKVIKEMGYHPNGIARGLVNKRTNTIAVLIPEFRSSFSENILKGIEESAHNNEYSIIVCNTGAYGKRTLDYVNVLREKKVDGLIMTSVILEKENYESLKTLNIPIVLLSSISERFSIPFVRVDDHQAAYDATSYLIQNGHKNLAMIGGAMEDKLSGLPRYEGFKKALIDHNLPVREKLIIEGDFSFNSGKESMKKLLKYKDEFTAIFAASDDMAIGAISSAYDHHLKVPEDVSIIGYDNSHIAEMAIPPLTTVAQPLTEMGKSATSILVKMMNDQSNVPSLIMPHKIIERKTVKQLQKDSKRLR